MHSEIISYTRNVKTRYLSSIDLDVLSVLGWQTNGVGADRSIRSLAKFSPSPGVIPI